MKSKNWIWILTTVALVIIVAITAICLTKCGKDVDPRESAIVLTKDSEAFFYSAEVLNGNNGKTYVFKSQANEHLYNICVIQSEGEESIDSSKYSLKMYDKDYKEIAMTYNANKKSITLTNEEGLWNTEYKDEDVYFAITLKADLSFKLELLTIYA